MEDNLMKSNPLFKFSAKGVAEIYNTLSMILSHYINKESISVQRMIGAAENMLANNNLLAKYVKMRFEATDILYTTTEEFKPKQDGCLLLFTGRHPSVKTNSLIYVSSFLGTYHVPLLFFFKLG